jgi:tetratricopeptide (TPR) repeat protein
MELTTSFEGIFNRAQAFEKNGKYKESLKDYNKCLEMNNKHIYSYIGRANVYKLLFNTTLNDDKEKDFDLINNSITDLKKSIDLDIDNKFNSLANSYHKLASISSSFNFSHLF